MTTQEFEYATATSAEVKAEADRRAELRGRGLPISPRAPPDVVVVKHAAVGKSTDPVELVDPDMRSFTLPWSSLLSDNAKYAPALRRGRAAIILTPAYRTAKARAQLTIERQLGGLPPLKGPCRLVARMFEPDRRTRRDITNCAKLVHDALTGLAFLDDSQLDDVRWIRTGVDIDRPRLDLLLTALAPGRVRP